MRRKITVLFFWMLLGFGPVTNVFAQQDPLYVQYMDNLLVVNPGFAGSKEQSNALIVARNQWVEIDGAPATRSFAYNTPLESKNIGLGFSVLSDRIGPVKQTGVYADYSYFIRVSEKFRLGMGLKAGVSFYRANFSDLVTIDPNDPVLDNDIYNNFLPNIGVGFYLFSDRSYFGFSAPHLIQNNIYKKEVATQYVNRQNIHLYFVAGRKFDLSNDIQLKTSGLARWVKDSPFTVDMTVLGGFREKVWLGGMYRLNAAYGGIIQFKPVTGLTVGYSYELAQTRLNSYQGGTHEIMIGYDFNFAKRKATDGITAGN